MARVSNADLRGIFRFLGSGAGGTDHDPIPVPTLAAMQDLIGAEDASYFELRRSDRAVMSYATTTVDVWAPGSEEAMLVFGHQSPTSWRGWRPADGALRLSGMVSHRGLERLEYYQYFMRPNSIRDNIKVWLWASPATAACVSLWRAGADFTSREQVLLGVLQHHLIRMRKLALAGSPDTSARGAWLTPREAEVLTWAVRGMLNGEIADLLGTSPATIGKHLEHVYEKLGVHSRAEALALMTLSGRLP